MFLNRLLSPLTIDGEGSAAGGGGSPTLDAIDDAQGTAADQGDQGDQGKEGDRGGEGEQGGEGEGGDQGDQGAEGDQGTEGKDKSTAKEGKPAKGKEPEFVPYKRFKEVVDKVHAMETGQHNLLKTIQSMRPKVDPIDDVISKLPDGDANAAEGTDDLKKAQFKSDIKALTPLLRTLLPAIIPNLDAQNNALNYLMKNHNEVHFLVEELIKTVPEDKLPLGIRALDKIKAHRDQVFQSSRGERFLPMRDAFGEIEEQATQEFDQSHKTEEQIRKDERIRTQREAENRRTVSGSPGNTGGTAPRGSNSGRRRTPADIDKGNFRLP